MMTSTREAILLCINAGAAYWRFLLSVDFPLAPLMCLL